MRWAGCIARMVESEDACGVLVWDPEEQRPLGKWENNISMGD